MKKIFTLVLFAAALSINAASAQNRYGRYDKQDRYREDQRNGYRNDNDRYQSKTYGYDKDRDRDRDYNRRVEYDRMNRDCDRQIEVYRNDRSLNTYERNRRIQEVEHERQEKAKAFGSGIVAGGIAAIILGVMIAHGH